ncbi:hypothetical protein ACOMHN_055141 [Nucella lapillus]
MTRPDQQLMFIVPSSGHSSKVSLLTMSGSRGENGEGAGKRWPCERCGKVYAHQPSLSRHKKMCLAHRQFDPTCSLCGKTFAGLDQLREHMVGAHSLPYRYI